MFNIEFWAHGFNVKSKLSGCKSSKPAGLSP